LIHGKYLDKKNPMTNVVKELAQSVVSVVQPYLSEVLKLLHRDEQRDALAATFSETKKNQQRAVKVTACHRSFRQWRCRNGHTFAVPERSCGERLCPHCAHYRVGVLVKRLQKLLLERFGADKSRLRYTVLTIKNTKSLADGHQQLMEYWTRLRRSVFWKDYVAGSMIVFEVTYNAITETWHPHLNVLMEGEYIPVEALHQAWMKATKVRGEKEPRGEVVWIQAVNNGTANELIKYTCKTADLIGRPDAVDEFQAAMSGRRLIRTYGTFFRLKTDDEAEPQGLTCPTCDCAEVVRMGHVLPRQLAFDELCAKQGFMVVKESPPPAEVDFWERRATEFHPWELACPMHPPSPTLKAMDRMLQPTKDAIAAARQKLWDDYLVTGKELPQ
jgi:hypothetical protein